MDLSEVPVDEVLPENLIDDSVDSSKSTFQRVADMARKEKLTVRQMYERYGGARGQRTVIGTPTQIADQMEEWFLAGAVDGFLIQPAVLPTGLDEFAETVIPELQRRGLFRTEYEGSTLREISAFTGRWGATPARASAALVLIVFDVLGSALLPGAFR
ncbi:nitrilotriacetate monooxygenase [Pseudoroseomonas wenyumeiae]